jgi:hypothetical protein
MGIIRINFIQINLRGPENQYLLNLVTLMDKDSNRKKWGRDKISKHGKITERKDNKNLFGFPNEKSYRNHKDEYFPEVMAKKK